MKKPEDASMTATTPIRVIAFPGAPNLPTFAAIKNGFFAEQGLAVDVSITPSSVFQAEKMSEGEFEIAFTAFDNVVAYSEGQGAKPGLNPDYCVIAGATQLELGLIAHPDITGHADLTGKTIALDALATGFAFVLVDMLARKDVPVGSYEIVAVGATPQRWQSVKSGEHAATITIEPFTSIARKSGFSLVDLSTNLYEAYQGGIIAARRPWLAENADTATAFLRGYLKGLAWTLDPVNRDAAEALLLDRMPEIQPAAAKAVMTSLMSPKSGLTPGAAIVADGMRQVLALRSRFGKGQVELTDFARYLELGCLERATRTGL
jgi:ABC-type nitrate/sulfonate/bicarbonate transport system substrate-binding protein